MQLYELSASEMTVDRFRTMLPESDAGIQRAIPFIQEMVIAVRDRSERAENRAAVVLGATGVLSGFVVGFADKLQDSSIEGWLMLGGLFLGTLALLIKAIFYGLRALDALRGFELSPEIGIRLSGMTEKDAKREELAARVWEYYQLLKVTNSRLYYSQRSLINLALAVVALALTTMSSIIFSSYKIEVPTQWQIGGAITILVLALFADKVIELASRFWKWIP